DYDKAAKYLEEGLKFNRKIENKEGILRALNSIGQLNLAQKNTKIAENQIFEAQRLAKDVGNNEELLKNYKLLMALDSTKGKFQNAYRWQREYFNLKQTLDQENQPQLPVNTDSIEEILEKASLIAAVPPSNITAPSNQTDQV